MNVVEEYRVIEPYIIRSCQAIATFFMWLKLLYFLRIFRSTSYLIRMVIIVISEMRIFLLILFITVIAFGDSLLKIAYGNEPGDDQFIKSFPGAIFFTYNLILGDWDTDKFGSVALPLVNALFVLCTLLNMVVMLNLLISIIGESFSRITENSENASY